MKGKASVKSFVLTASPNKYFLRVNSSHNTISSPFYPWKQKRATFKPSWPFFLIPYLNLLPEVG
ncbi:hypothetical protein [Ammonifex degensii]|uniref:hypothetical protein n=1 Tax=Ammonifex degensii TaxID=42838 RepID=UPI0002E0C7CB|nr:hypothetical protein [Ammonifex degensii]